MRAAEESGEKIKPGRSPKELKKIMRTLAEIKDQRAANAEAIKEAEAGRAQLQENFLMARAEKRGAEVVRGIMDEMAAADQKTKRLQKVGYILRNNYKSALAAQVVPVISTLLQKYHGKKAGEKTLAKFRDELTKAASVSIYFERGIFSQKSTRVSIYEIIDGFRGGETIDIYTKSGAEFINDNNEFCAPCLSDLQPLYLSYIDNPEKRLDEIEQAAAEVKRIAAEYNAAADAYNALTVDGFEHIRRI